MTKTKVAAAALATVSMLAIGSAQAATLVSTISGSYDVLFYDTPALTINNTTGFSFTNVQMVLTPYQTGTDTAGLAPQTISLGDVGAGSSENVIWLDGYGGTVKGDLFSYDYDDSYGQTTTNSRCTQPFAICSDVGNFQVTFTATWNNPAYGGGAGTEISSVFSPTTNATGGFVGWEGLDPQGWSETSYDSHSGGITDDLANIYVGAPTSGVPEPATWAMMLAGVGAIGAAMRKARKSLPLQAVY